MLIFAYNFCFQFLLIFVFTQQATSQYQMRKITNDVNLEMLMLFGDVHFLFLLIMLILMSVFALESILILIFAS